MIFEFIEFDVVLAVPRVANGIVQDPNCLILSAYYWFFYAFSRTKALFLFGLFLLYFQIYP